MRVAADEHGPRDDLLTARVTGALWWDRNRGLEQVDELVQLRAEGTTGRFRPLAVKIMQDGVAESFTAGMQEPYLDGHGHPTGNRGLSYVEPELLAEAVTLLDRRGFQVHVHAIGDRAVRETLDAFAAARVANGPSAGRHHLAHLQVVHPDDVPRFSELDLAANIQPLWACHEPQMDELTLPFLGEPRGSWQYPFGDLLRCGTRLAAGSDWPVSSADPLHGIQVAVTRLGKRIYRDELHVVEEEDGRRRFRIYGDSPVHDDEEGTDLAAVAAGRVAVTPLHFDLTAEYGLEALRAYDLDALLGPAAEELTE